MQILNNEAYISVDVETAGPIPAQYSMLSIGACTVFEPIETFYVELKPERMDAIPQALAISQLDMDDLNMNGEDPQAAMSQFEAWLNTVVPAHKIPVFVAFNAPFDWMFINDYFHRHQGRNPFGHSALDVKSFYMGLKGVNWKQTGMVSISGDYLDNRKLTHHALNDALDQAELFRKLLKESGVV